METVWTNAAPQEMDWTEAALPETVRTVAAPLEMMRGQLKAAEWQ